MLGNASNAVHQDYRTGCWRSAWKSKLRTPRGGERRNNRPTPGQSSAKAGPCGSVGLPSSEEATSRRALKAEQGLMPSVPSRPRLDSCLSPCTAGAAAPGPRTLGVICAAQSAGT
ncbi:hypothetical protein F751_6169 [Auxenochlorella protothecoides]|uniref:Uncharacterized protein n=1 Tax=Auxenochlorella protothecoides TaxID=3075 RepID=A0A087SHL0_AUXPR|nr:hypothetical protein F751_6169 [Auxenochlorella protothecoides]KFM25214.1 hypothetical protein F751_6169 [Auxenochlorella protothecoides]